jgi:hypothetical protein
MTMESIAEGGHYPVELVSSLRQVWEHGTVVEYQHLGRWLPSLIVNTSPDGQMLTLSFMCDGINVQHTVTRASVQITHFGVHYSVAAMQEINEKHFLPPGFHTEASRSRPGHLAFADRSGLTCMRYGSLALAWKAYLERMQQMEALPTVSDLHPPSEACFSWGGAAEQQVDTLSMDHPVELASDVCFSANVLTELLAAPSPNYVPTAVFAKTSVASKDRAACEKPFENEFSFEKLPDARAIIVSHLDGLAGLADGAPEEGEAKIKRCPTEEERHRVLQRTTLPEPIDIGCKWRGKDGAGKGLPAPLDASRVAHLEGALEESRDQVEHLMKLSKDLETLERKNACTRHSLEKASQREVFHHQVPVRVEVVRTPKSVNTTPKSAATMDSMKSANTTPTGTMIWDSMLEECTTYSEKEGNVFTVDNGLLEEAHKISGLRRAVDALHVKSEDYERRFEDIQNEIYGCMSAHRGKEIEPRYSGANQTCETEKYDSQYGASSQAVAAVKNVQSQVVAGRGFTFNPEGSEAEFPSVVCEVKVVTPRSSRAKAHVPLPRARTPPRSPKVFPPMGDKKSEHTSKLDDASSVASSYARTLKLDDSSSVASSVTRPLLGRSRGPPRRSLSSANSGSPTGSPPAGFRTPRSLSPAVVATPAKENRCPRGSSVSISGRSSIAGSCASVSVTSVSSPDRCYKLCPQTLMKKTTTHFVPPERSTTPTRAHAVPQWCKVRTTSISEGWCKLYREVA